MNNQPIYRLRPNKYIDRQLFTQLLIGLSRIYKLSDYTYTGFGSYTFEDYKLLHESLNIKKMVSLESEPDEYLRATYNCPYRCIKVKNTNSTDYISRLSIPDNENNIFWLDYSVASALGQQMADLSSVLNLLNPYDIIRITLNANPSSLGDNNDPITLQEYRLQRLRERVGSNYLPTDIDNNDMTNTNYPITLLRIIKAVSMESLDETPPYRLNFLYPLFATVYSDGQQMLTFTGIVLNDHTEEKKIRNILKTLEYINFSWDSPCGINIPPLTTKEIIEINKMLPPQRGQQRIKKRDQILHKFPFLFTDRINGIAGLESYVSFYKHYPNFHHVSF